MNVGAIILAAGEGRRLGGGGKARLEVGGVSFLERVIRTSRDGGCGTLWVVVRADHEETLEMARSLGCRLVVNENPEQGMFSSVLAGLTAAQTPEAGQDPETVDAYLVFPVDHPRVHADTVRTLIHALPASAPNTYAYPSHEGRGGHPILIGAAGAHRMLDHTPTGVFRDVLAEAGLSAREVPRARRPHPRELQHAGRPAVGPRCRPPDPGGLNDRRPPPRRAAVLQLTVLCLTSPPVCV